MRTLLAAFAITGTIVSISGLSQRVASAEDTAKEMQSSLPGTDEHLGRELVTQRCKNCHAIETGKTSFAPTLVGIIGRKAGSVEGFRYTKKISMLNIEWSPEALDNWLATITTGNPDLRMRHVGVPVPHERKAVIAFLQEISK